MTFLKSGKERCVSFKGKLGSYIDARKYLKYFDLSCTHKILGLFLDRPQDVAVMSLPQRRGLRAFWPVWEGPIHPGGRRTWSEGGDGIARPRDGF